MTDVTKLREFAQVLEWEGGWGEAADHGVDNGTGDGKLDTLLEKLMVAREALDERWRELNNLYDLTWEDDGPDSGDDKEDDEEDTGLYPDERDE